MQIGDRVTIKESCIDNFCKIEDDATIVHSAIMDRVVVGEGASIKNSIVGRHVRIISSKMHSTRISNMSVIGDDTLVGEGCRVSNVKIFPHRNITEGSTAKNLTIS